MKCVLGIVLASTIASLATTASADPPAHRVVQAGTDVIVGEEIATGPREAQQIVFPDGGALTLGPESRLTVDRLVYDARSGIGDVIVNIRHGVLRFTGGSTSMTMPAVIATPSSTLTIRDGTAIAHVTPASTVAILAEGTEMKVVANGRTEIVSQPGWQSTTFAGASPGAAVPAPAGTPQTDVARLEAPERSSRAEQ